MRQHIALAILTMFLFAGCNNKTQQLQQEIAIMKIANYAQNHETPPQLQDYIDAEVKGITADNLSDINAFILELNYEDIDTLEEIQAIVNKFNLSLEDNTTVEENKPSPTPLPTQEPTVEPSSEPTTEATQTPVEVVATPTPTPVATPTLTPELNSSPVVDAGSDKSIELGQSVTLSAIASDSDGDAMSYEWSQSGVVLATTLSFEYTPSSEGNHTLTFEANDGNASASDSLNVEVSEECDPLSQFVGAC